MSDGFVSNGNGRCRKCGLTRVEFGFMPGKCECTSSGIHVVSSPETIEAVKKGRMKRNKNNVPLERANNG